MLMRNGTLLQQYPVRLFGGVNAPDRTLFGRGDRINMFTALTKLASVPNGYRPPVAWVMPINAGAMTSQFEAVASVVGTAIGNLGRSIAADGVLAVVGTAAGGLIVSALADGTLVVSANGDIVALLAASADGALIVSAAGDINALGHASADGTVSVNGALTSYAVGYLAGEYTPFTELSPEGLARAVWQAAASAYNEAGSMGEKLNAAGAAGDPLTGEIEGGETLRETMRLIRAVLLGDGASLEGTPMEFRSKDGTKVRVRATYDAGTRTITLVDAT